MSDKVKIIIGLMIFIILITFPIWYNFAQGKAAYQPEIEVATQNTPGKDVCVKEAEYMRTSHMDVLNEWRDKVVREGNRDYVGFDGKEYKMISLTHTCLDCHSNKDKFCDRCHNYVGVDPYCWECHIIPEEGR